MKKEFIYHDTDSIIKPLIFLFIIPPLFSIFLSIYLDQILYNVLGGLLLFFTLLPFAIKRIIHNQDKEHFKLNSEGLFYKGIKKFEVKDIRHFDWDYTIPMRGKYQKKFIIIETVRGYKYNIDVSCTGIDLNDFQIKANQFIEQLNSSDK
ncbi:hypothetical protein [Flammeovirga pacifica]|uniref:Uncharacterized protein n=1 Tax=Flammeovirga pacifica TaxID=915059 RepID=A0A1S1YS85_FLAPC|nr:hypothetical protein [Flammeovirga pacifica]OHX63892.1 hypothetical protein NH26_19975 [Flammeovirga pacifica]